MGRIRLTLRNLLAQATEIRVTPDVLKAIAIAYQSSWPAVMLFRAGVSEAVVDYPLLTAPEWLIDCAVESLDVCVDEEVRHHNPVDYAFIAWLKMTHRIWNGRVCLFQGISKTHNEVLTLKVRSGKYYCYLSECKKLELAATRLTINDGLPIQWPSAPKGGEIQRVIPSAAAVGVVALILGPARSSGSEVELILQQRGSKSLGSRGLWCPCPAFTLRPDSFENAPFSESLKSQLMDEIAEECLGRPDLEFQIVGKDSLLSTGHSCTTVLRSLEESLLEGSSSLRFLGIGVDGTNLEPSLALLLWIRDCAVYHKLCAGLRGNWESSCVRPFRLGSNELDGLFSRFELTPAGAFAITRSIGYVRSALSSRM